MSLGRPRRRGGIIRVGITEIGVNMKNWNVELIGTLSQQEIRKEIKFRK